MRRADGGGEAGRWRAGASPDEVRPTLTSRAVDLERELCPRCIASLDADRLSAQPDITAHYIAKAGLIVLTRTLAKALGKHGITANTISPGFIASGSAPDEELDRMLKHIPAGYVGELSDAVSAARFLLSDEARCVNGANLHLSGGWGL